MKKYWYLFFLVIISSQSYAFEEKSIDNAWRRFGHDKINTGYTHSAINSDNVNQLTLKWKIVGNSISAQPIISHGIVYYTDFGGSLYARQLSNGALVWSTTLNTPNTQALSAPHIDGDMLYIGGASNATAYAFNRLTGEQLWATVIDSHTAAYISSSPNVAGDRVFFATDSRESTQEGPYTFRGKIFGLNKSSGTIDWTYEPAQGSSPGTAIRSSSFALDTENKILFIGTGGSTEPPAAPQSTSLIALDYRDGTYLWSHQFAVDVYSRDYQSGRNNDIIASPHVFDANDDKLVAVYDKGGSLIAFNRLSGTIKWQKTLIPSQYPAAVVNNTSGATVLNDVDDETETIIAFGSYDPNDVLDGPTLMQGMLGDPDAVQDVVKALTKKLFSTISAFKAKNGKLLWAKEWQGTGSQALSATNNIVFVYGYNGRLKALKVKNGKKKWELKNNVIDIFGIQAREPFSVGPAIVGDNIVFGTGLPFVPNGSIQCYSLSKNK